MKLRPIEALQCSFCLSVHHGFGKEERAAACCTCPSCGAEPSKWCGLFKVCRVCAAMTRVKDARASLRKAVETVELAEREYEAARQEPTKTEEPK